MNREDLVIFDNFAFTLNEDLKHWHEECGTGKVIVVDNFYKDFDRVVKEIPKLTLTTTGCDNEHVFDGRASYASNMPGTELPFVMQWGHKLKEIVGYRGDNMVVDTHLYVNAQFIQKPEILEDHYYNIHVDPSKERPEIATVVFLNEHYEEGEGFTIYSKDSKESDTLRFFRKDECDIIKHVQGKPNRAVVFMAGADGDPHSGALATDQFTKEMRYTQIIFTQI